MPVSEKEQQEINTLVQRFEADTGIEAVAVVVSKADSYPEIPWKAFALGSAIAGLVMVIFPLLVTRWGATPTAAYAAMAVLGAGSVCAAAAAFIRPVGRLFLDGIRAQGEARQYALGVFVQREVFRTRKRTAVVMLVARLEGVAVILPDTGLVRYAPPAELERISAAMGLALKAQGPAAAFERGFEGLAASLHRHAYRADDERENVLDDGMLAEHGP